MDASEGCSSQLGGGRVLRGDLPFLAHQEVPNLHVRGVVEASLRARVNVRVGHDCVQGEAAKDCMRIQGVLCTWVHDSKRALVPGASCFSLMRVHSRSSSVPSG